MHPIITGLHHVTAITGDAQKNIDFYCGILGLRLTKLTVNFDDPQIYHLYYGDELGRPGTSITFFAAPGAPRGRIGPPQVSATALAIPRDALAFWSARLKDVGIATAAGSRLGEDLLTLQDPDGITVELVGLAEPGGTPPRGGPVDPARAIRGLHSITLTERDSEPTTRMLTQVMGFSHAGSEGNRQRFCASGGFAALVDVLDVATRRGSMGSGIIHHVAFRTPDDEHQLAWRATLIHDGHDVSAVIDRKYFHSIYFSEPGGANFEIATDGPGFQSDETSESLGQELRLPQQYESLREQLTRVLPPVRLPPWEMP
jgi:glyoxalase family protein